MKLSIIIVNYNVKYYLEQCLLSVQRATEGVESEVIVVDNASHDGSIGYLSERFTDVVFLQSNQNLGFAKANNKAIKQSRGEYVLLLNPDTVVGEEVLRECIRFMDAHPKAGGAGVRMLKTDGSDAKESRRGIPTPMTSFYKMTGLCSFFPKSKVFGKYYMGYLSWDAPTRIEIVSGAFCMLRRKALDEVGLLDEDFFMYGEDIDLSYRIIKGGWENWYLPLRILHYKGESTQKTNFRYVHVFYEAMFIFLRKHYGNLSFFFSIPIRLGIYCKAFQTLCSMTIEKVRRRFWRGGREKVDDTSYCFDVEESHRQHCQALIRRNELHARFCTDVEDEAKVTADEGVIYMVYDISKFSFTEILEKISSDTNPQTKVAFYNPNNQSVVTESKILF